MRAILNRKLITDNYEQTQTLKTFSFEVTSHNMDKDELIRLFQEFLSTDSILSEEEDLRPYECDGLSAYRTLPWTSLFPRCG